MNAYEKLAERSREVSLLQKINAVLDWDHQTGLPPKAEEYRATQGAHLSTWSHRLFTAKEVGEWIREAEQFDYSDGSVERANVREWRRSYDRAVKIPDELVSEFSRLTSLGHGEWVAARSANDYARFAPVLQRIIAMRREMADRWGFASERYDALIEEFEPGWTVEAVEQLFGELAPRQSALVQRGIALPPPDPLPCGPYPVEAQQRFNRAVAEALGFDFSAGRINTAVHPFCTTLGPSDVRLTTRYDEQDFTSSLYGVLHEAGHGLYELGLPKEHFGTPVGDAVSLGIHESQSRLWENHVGRSLAFWRHWHAEAVRHFPQLATFSPEQLTRYVNRVERTFIRVEADEVTYDLHIILRYRIERALIRGDLEAGGVPEAWNSQFEKLFGMRPPDDAHGCLQDVHWSGGALGYFPTYTLGNLNAAQLMTRAHIEIPSLEAELASGRYAPLLGWLRAKVHHQGSLLQPQELVRNATGSTTSIEHHLERLEKKVTSPVS